MANVPEITTFVAALNTAVNALLEMREDMAATDRLWLALTAPSITAIRAAENDKLVVAKALVAALVVP